MIRALGQGGSYSRKKRLMLLPSHGGWLSSRGRVFAHPACAHWGPVRGKKAIRNQGGAAQFQDKKLRNCARTMSKAEANQFRAKADECEEKAEQATDAEAKRVFRQAAEDWRILAVLAERR
jgi:hypothetical protein